MGACSCRSIPLCRVCGASIPTLSCQRHEPALRHSPMASQPSECTSLLFRTEEPPQSPRPSYEPSLIPPALAEGITHRLGVPASWILVLLLVLWTHINLAETWGGRNRVSAYIWLHGTVVCLLHYWLLREEPGIIQTSRNPRTGIELLCAHCRAKRVPRSQHCMSCGVCVKRYDQHCWWVNRCIGLENQGIFVLWLLFKLGLLVGACAANLCVEQWLAATVIGGFLAYWLW